MTAAETAADTAADWRVRLSMIEEVFDAMFVSDRRREHLRREALDERVERLEHHRRGHEHQEGRAAFKPHNAHRRELRAQHHTETIVGVTGTDVANGEDAA